jgi:ribonuclease P protein component
MLSREKRLTRADFDAVAKGKRAISAHFSVSAAPSSLGKAAAVVSKKVAKRSVDRHLLKRRMLAAAVPYIRPGRSFVLYARAGSPSLPFGTLKRELTELLTKLPAV